MSSDSAVTRLDEAALVSDALDVGFSFPVGPGPVLLGGLVSTDVQTVDEAGLVDMVAGLRRCAAFVDAMTARVVAELAARRGGLTPPAETEEELLDPDQCAVVESRVLADGRAVTPGQFRSRAERLALELSGPDPEPVEPERSLWAERSAEGGVELHASLTADGGHVVATCLDALATPTGPDDDRPVATRRADALVELCRWRPDAGDLPPTPSGARPHLALLATPNDLCESTFAPIGLRTRGSASRPCRRALRGGSPATPALRARPSTRLAGSRHSAARPGSPPRPCAVGWNCATGPAGSPAARGTPAAATPTTSSTGPTAARRRTRT